MVAAGLSLDLNGELDLMAKLDLGDDGGIAPSSFATADAVVAGEAKRGHGRDRVARDRARMLVPSAVRTMNARKARAKARRKDLDVK